MWLVKSAAGKAGRALYKNTQTQYSAETGM